MLDVDDIILLAENEVLIEMRRALQNYNINVINTNQNQDFGTLKKTSINHNTPVLT